MIRDTWGNPDIPDVATRLVFLLGATDDTKLQNSISEESSAHGDIVQGEFLDTYHNLSYKAIMGNLWVSEFCEQAEFVVKTDDDQFVDLYEVYDVTRYFLDSTQYLENKFLLCPAWEQAILRDQNQKHHASYEDIPRQGEVS